MKWLLREHAAGEIRTRPGITTQAFTIIELMAAILLIVLLVGLAMGVVSHAFTLTKTSRARAEIEALSLALEDYRSDRGGLIGSELGRWISR